MKKLELLSTAAWLVAGLGLASAAVAAPSEGANRIAPAYGDIEPFYGNIEPFYGNIEPFYGNIEPFYGNIEPFYGNIEPFYGNIEPFYGNIEPFYGNIEPFYGNIEPFYGNIEPFYGNIEPFYGNIEPFYGNIEPFYGNIEPFYGNIEPFYGNIEPFYGNIEPFYGNIEPFYGNIEPFYGDIDSFAGDLNSWYGDIEPFWDSVGRFWTQSGHHWTALNHVWTELNKASADERYYKRLAVELSALMYRTARSWGPAVRAETGQSFWDGFARDLLTKYGIDLRDPSSLSTLSPARRASFYLEWRDGLMSFTGRDHLDLWMPVTGWSPRLAAPHNGGETPIVGLLDTRIAGDADLLSKVSYSGGYDYTNGHSAAVASLIAASIDGEGVMGVAPLAELVSYNPFDDTGTAGWDDVRTGLAALGERNASVVNMSLGVPGQVLDSEWANVFSDPRLADDLKSTVYVKAAGNGGVAQTVDVSWDGLDDVSLLLVGSVDYGGRISSFSNTPGEACLLTGGECQEENKLKYRYLVAPGELVLTSDGAGGVTRHSGTSLAAPFVSGAVALLHQRWPWLKEHAAESADIILQSARDLGDPGVDGVYGHGLLDIAASQAPLDVSQLVFYEEDGSRLRRSNARISRLVQGQRTNWSADGAVIHAFESIGDTHRDFQIPVESLLVGQTVGTSGPGRRFESYLDNRVSGFTGRTGFTDVTTTTAPLNATGREGVWSLQMTVANRAPNETVSDSALPFQTGMVMRNADTGTELRFGHGEGAMALSGRSGFGVFSDYDGETGGVNPVLGLASGGLYFGGGTELTERVSLNVGVTQQRNKHFYVNPISGAEESLVPGLRDYQAAAMNVGAEFFATNRVSFNMSYTYLYEDTGLLGVQGIGPLAFGGASTDAATFGASLALDYGFDLSASATTARTRTAGVDGGVLTLTDNGVTSTAFGLALAKAGVFSEQDRLRFSLAQPLQVESGAMEYRSVQVVNRETGELGAVSESFDFGGERDYVFEALYAVPVLQGRGEVAAFGRAEMADSSFVSDQSGLAVGARFGLDF